jgi:hypothetical protein
MPSLDEITRAAESTRPRRSVGASAVRPQWCEACREAHVWCDVCGSLSCRHVLESGPAVAARPRREGARRVG